MLEKIRWGKVVTCPYCGSEATRRNTTQSGRHSCKSCKRTFSVFIDTIFEGTRLPLPTWFQIIANVLNAKSGMSSKYLQRNYDLSYKTAYYTAMRIRVGMLMPNTILHGILEMDESYFSSTKKDVSQRIDDPTLSNVSLKRGRGTNKTAVVGIVQRDGSVKTKVINKLTQRNLLAMLKRYAKMDDSILITDGFRSYKKMDAYIEHLVAIHSKKQFSKGFTNVNTIEGFWSYVKNGIKGNYKSVSPKYLPFYLIQYEWNYNQRYYTGDLFIAFLHNALTQEKELLYWKAKSKQKVRQVAYS